MSEYAQALAQTSAGDKPAEQAGAADYGKLRLECGQRDDVEKLCVIDRPLHAAAVAMNQNDLGKVQDVADGWLQRCPVDSDKHIILASTLRHAGKAAEVDVQATPAWGLLKSILDSGDGKTQKTAWVVISVSEECAVLDMVHIKPGKQALLMDPMCRHAWPDRTGRAGTVLVCQTERHIARFQKRMFGPAMPAAPAVPEPLGK